MPKTPRPARPGGGVTARGQGRDGRVEIIYWLVDGGDTSPRRVEPWRTTSHAWIDETSPDPAILGEYPRCGRDRDLTVSRHPLERRCQRSRVGPPDPHPLQHRLRG